MSKKGFTLIELLAVIVILAIIALIATPIVLDVISDARKSSTEISMENIDKAANLFFQNNRKIENIIFECNKDKCIFGENELEINGKSPESGRILIDKKGNITYEDIVLNNFNCYKEHKKFVCDSKKTRKTYNESKIVIKSESEYNLFDYNIYGNSIQNETTSQYESVGEKTKNLFDINKALDPSNYVITSYGYYGFPIEVEIGKTYTFNRNNANGYGLNLGNIGFKNTVDAAITGWLVSTDSESLNNSIYTFTATTNIIYFCTNIREQSKLKQLFDTVLKDAQLEEGAQATNYEPSGYKIPIKINGKNLLDKNLSQIGYHGYIKSNGYTLDGVLWSDLDVFKERKIARDFYVTKPIPIKPNTVYSYSGLQTNVNPAYFFLEEDMTTIIDGEAIKGSKTFTTPESAKYIVMSIKDEFIETMMLEEGEITEYEPYINPINIYIGEPLRKVGDKVDYIDFKNQRVVIYIEEDNLGNLKILSTPKEEKIELPEILLQKGTNNIEIDTNIKPSKIELEYYK